MSSARWRRRIGIIGIVFCVLLAAIVAFVLYQQKSKPERVLRDAVAHMIDDMEQGRKFAGEGSAEVTLMLFTKKYTFPADVIVSDNQGIYVRMKDLSNELNQLMPRQPELAGYQTSFSSIVDKVDNQWIKITPEVLRSSQDDTSKGCRAALQNLRFSSDEKERFGTLFRENQFVASSKDSPKEKIGGETSFHYIVDLTSEKAKSFMQRVINYESFVPIKNDCNFNIDTKGVPKIELWVGEKSRRFNKIRVEVIFKQNMTLNAVIELKDQLQSVPEKPLLIDQLQKEIQAALLE